MLHFAGTGAAWTCQSHGMVARNETEPRWRCTTCTACALPAGALRKAGTICFGVGGKGVLYHKIVKVESKPWLRLFLFSRFYHIFMDCHIILIYCFILYHYNFWEFWLTVSWSHDLIFFCGTVPFENTPKRSELTWIDQGLSSAARAGHLKGTVSNQWKQLVQLGEAAWRAHRHKLSNSTFWPRCSDFGWHHQAEYGWNNAEYIFGFGDKWLIHVYSRVPGERCSLSCNLKTAATIRRCALEP